MRWKLLSLSLKFLLIYLSYEQGDTFHTNDRRSSIYVREPHTNRRRKERRKQTDFVRPQATLLLVSRAGFRFPIICLLDVRFRWLQQYCAVMPSTFFCERTVIESHFATGYLNSFVRTFGFKWFSKRKDRNGISLGLFARTGTLSKKRNPWSASTASWKPEPQLADTYKEGIGSTLSNQKDETQAQFSTTHHSLNFSVSSLNERELERLFPHALKHERVISFSKCHW